MKRSTQARRQASRAFQERFSRKLTGQAFYGSHGQRRKQKQHFQPVQKPMRKLPVAKKRELRRLLRGQSVFEALMQQRGMERQIAGKSGLMRNKKSKANSAIRALRRSASRYSVKSRQVILGRPITEKRTVTEPEHYATDPWGFKQWSPATQTVKEVIVGYQKAGEKLVLKRQSRKSGGRGGKGSSGADRGIIRATGTMSAKRGRAKSARIGGKKGAFPGKEKKKRGKR